MMLDLVKCSFDISSHLLNLLGGSIVDSKVIFSVVGSCHLCCNYLCNSCLSVVNLHFELVESAVGIFLVPFVNLKSICSAGAYHD